MAWRSMVAGQLPNQTGSKQWSSIVAYDSVGRACVLRIAPSTGAKDPKSVTTGSAVGKNALRCRSGVLPATSAANPAEGLLKRDDKRFTATGTRRYNCQAGEVGY